MPYEGKYQTYAINHDAGGPEDPVNPVNIKVPKSKTWIIVVACIVIVLVIIAFVLLNKSQLNFTERLTAVNTTSPTTIEYDLYNSMHGM
jgi:hypothetical protein